MTQRAFAACAVALAMLAGPANAAVSSFARVEPRGNPGPITNQGHSDTAESSSSTVTVTIGTAHSFATALPGSLSGAAQVQLSTTAPYFGGELFAHAQAFIEEQLTFGNQYCVGASASCVDAMSLGIDHVDLHVRIHASGNTAVTAGTTFDNAESTVSFSWAVLGGLNGTVNGGGNQSVRTVGTGEPVGSIASQEATVSVRPGGSLAVDLSMELGAIASVAGLSENEALAGNVAQAAALADFAHTLQWRGVFAFEAFDAQGARIDLAPGGRFTLVGTSGHDFWQATPVPLPPSAMLMLAGLGLCARRRPARVRT